MGFPVQSVWIEAEFNRDRTIYNPWHHVGALRNGAPFKDWVLPGALEQIRRKLQGSSDGSLLDELGYLPFAQFGDQLLLRLVSRLYEQTSVIVTTKC